MKALLTKLLCGIAILLLMPAGAFAQDGTITGTVTDTESNDPLPGATVQVSELGIGAATDVDGNFEFTVPAGEHVVSASFVGYTSSERTVTVEAGGTTEVNFNLRGAAAELDEVVVTGVSVGTSTRKLGFTVSKISEEDLQNVPGTDPANALRAKTPGARIVQASGQPGTAPSVRLRGTTTLSGSQEPLVVVDGAITGGGLEDIDMQAVKSIEIIKGAAASSLYGSLAGNGVIQVITKRGSEESAGTTRVTVRNEVGFTQLANTLDLSDHHNKAARDAGNTPITGPDVGGGEFRSDCASPPCPINPDVPDGIFDNDFSENNDQQEALYDPRAFFTNFISVASNQGGINYLLSFENVSNSGVVRGVDSYKRRNIRLNVDNQVTDRIDVSASLLYSNSEGFDIDEQGQGANNLFYGALLAFPDLDLEAPAPDSLNTRFNPFTTAGNAANPLYQATAIDRNTDDTRLFGNFQANADITDWLSVDGQFSWDQDDNTFSTFTPKGTFPTNPTDPVSQGSISEFESSERVAIAQGRALFSYDFGELTTDFTAKYAYEDRQVLSFGLAGSDFFAEGVPQFDNTVRDNLNPFNDFEATIRSEDVVGNLVLDYKDRYILDAVLRRESVSLFGPDARNETYYRLSGAYRLTEDFPIPYVDQLKLRGTYGISGSRPPFVAQYETFTVSPSGITKNRLGNSNIQPADVAEYSFGLDANFLGRFFFEGTYSSTVADNQVLEVPLSSAAGFSSQFQNAATLETSTFEFALGGQVLGREDWGVDVGIVFDRTRQEVTDLNRPSFNLDIGGAIPIFRIEEGVDLGAMYGNKLATSIDQLGFDDSGCLFGESGCVERGDLTVNGDGYVIVDGTQFTADEAPLFIRDESGSLVTTQIGDANPDFNMGFNTTVRYKNFSLFTTIDWEQGADIYNYTRQLLIFNERAGQLDQTDRPEGERRPYSYYQTLYNQASSTSEFVESGTFVKIREISLSYRFTNDLMNQIGLGGTIYDARFSLLGRNLFTFTDYSGFDPEVSTENADQPVNYKFDDFAYPNFRTFSASLELRF